MNSSEKTEQLRLILNQEDPIGIYFGDNPDEYDTEIAEILNRLPPCQNVDEIRKMVWMVFRNFFDEKIAGPEERYTKIANRVLDIK